MPGMIGFPEADNLQIIHYTSKECDDNVQGTTKMPPKMQVRRSIQLV